MLIFDVFSFRYTTQNDIIEKIEESDELLENETVVKVGLKLEKLIPAANNGFSGLILTFYLSTVSSLIAISFQFVVAIGLNSVLMGNKKYIFAGGLFLLIVMYIVRMYMIMRSGQGLAVQIKHSRRLLEEVMIRQEDSNEVPHCCSNKTFILRKRLELYEIFHPISPFSIFSVNIKTFCATLATIFTYIILLMKLRGIETSKTCTAFNLFNETRSEM